MSTVSLSIRLAGELPATEELTDLLGVKPTKILRRGEQVSKTRIQPIDSWTLELVKFDSDYTHQAINQHLLKATKTLQEMALSLAKLDGSQCKADLYISTIREEDQGGLSLPEELITAAAMAKLSLQISILVMLDDYEQSEISDEKIGTDPGKDTEKQIEQQKPIGTLSSQRQVVD